jgi:hypothetical protein
MSSELAIGVFNGEGSLDTSALRVSSLLPGVHLGSEGGAIGQAPTLALPIEDANLELGHVEPAACLGEATAEMHVQVDEQIA